MEGLRAPRPPSRARHSLRVRVFLAVAAASLLPLSLVFLWSQVDKPIPTRLGKRALDAAWRGRDALAVAEGPPAAELAALARAQRVRLRVVDARDAVVFDADEDQPEDSLHPIEAFFFGAVDGDTRRLDEELGPAAARSTTLAARAAEKLGGFVDCHASNSVVCEGAVPAQDARGAPYVVHAQASSTRALRQVYALRYMLARVMLLAVPFSVLIGLYAARRVSLPIEQLRQQALSKAKAASPNADLPEPSDEVGDLSSALNALLFALEAKRTAHQALAADLVHELKSPVATVRAIADALESGNAGPERLERLARALRESSSKLDRLVTQFLELARAEAGLPNEPRTPLDLHELATGITQSLESDARHEGKRFIVEGSGASEALVVAHRAEALLRELCENAASFTDEGGSVVVRVLGTEHEVTLEVSDDGPGITPDDLPKVWQRFFTTRGQKRGTGLGLALVRAVCEAHGGRVDVRSEPGKGATFSVTLPRGPLPPRP